MSVYSDALEGTTAGSTSGPRRPHAFDPALDGAQPFQGDGKFEVTGISWQRCYWTDLLRNSQELLADYSRTYETRGPDAINDDAKAALSFALRKIADTLDDGVIAEADWQAFKAEHSND